METGDFFRTAENMCLYLIEWQCKEQSGCNYYISGKPPLDYSVLVQQMKNAGLLLVADIWKRALSVHVIF